MHSTTHPKPITPISLPPERLGEIDAVVNFSWHKKLVAQHRRLPAWDRLAHARSTRVLSLEEHLQWILLDKRVRAWPGKGVCFTTWMSKHDPCLDYSSLLHGPLSSPERALLKQRFLDLSKKEIYAEINLQRKTVTEKFNKDWNEGGRLSFQAVKPPRIPPVLALSQGDHWVAEPNALAELLIQPWESIWNRHSQVPPAAWNTALDLVLPHLPTVPFAPGPITWIEWKKAVRRLGSYTAPGLCGWRGQELRMLPERVVAPMLKLFNEAEQAGEGLPQHLLYASVAMIAKCLNPQSAGDCRPITVLSCIYRAWTSARAASLQSWLVQVMPASMRGFLSKRHLEDFLYKLGLDIEAAQQGLTGPLLGMSLDMTQGFQLHPTPCRVRHTQPAWPCTMAYGIVGPEPCKIRKAGQSRWHV